MPRGHTLCYAHGMMYYTIQVRTKGEEKFIQTFTSRHPDTPLSFHFPRRRLTIRRMGKLYTELAPIFPGYIFIQTETAFSPLLYWELRKTEGFYRFLRSNSEPTPLSGKDLETVLHFIRLGPIAEKSIVYFDEQDRIVITEGPLKGLEGSIVKVDKRKGRAKVKLDLYNDSFTIDLAFTVITRA